MTEQEIAQHHTDLKQLDERLQEVREAGIRKPWSKDIFFLETELTKRWNQLVEKLTTANVHHEYKLKPIAADEKGVPLTWQQEMFVIYGLDSRDLMKDDKPPRSAFGDGLKDAIGY